MIDQESIIWDKLSGGIVGNDRPGAQDLRDSRLDSKLRVGRRTGIAYVMCPH